MDPFSIPLVFVLCCRLGILFLQLNQTEPMNEGLKALCKSLRRTKKAVVQIVRFVLLTFFRYFTKVAKYDICLLYTSDAADE